MTMSLAVSAHAAAAAPPLVLSCEGDADPAGIDVAAPRLAWTYADDAALPRGTVQTAYRVLVATSADVLARDDGDLWDTGRVESPTSVGVAYAGKPLVAGQMVFWKVRVWNGDADSGWSTPARWTMGLLAPGDWQPARWIGLPPTAITPPATQPVNGKAVPHQPASVLLRRDLDLPAAPRRATLFVTGLGQYEASINGAKVGDALMSPGWTEYRKTVLYDALDVADRLHAGANALEILLGNGMYHIEPTPGRYVKFTHSFGDLKAIAQLRVEFADGTTQTFATDAAWRASPGPITYSNIFGGEDLDARFVPAWQPAAETPGPGGTLRGHSVAAPAIRAIETIRPIAVNTVKPGTSVYDLGQNASTMPRVTFRGPAGSRVRIIPSELLGTDGLVDRQSCVQDAGGPAWWQWTLAGTGSEAFFPKFFYQGARYLQVELMPARDGDLLPVVESLDGVVIHSSAEPIGTFECSNDLFNRIYRLVRWAQRSNMMSLMTDCPQREKLGWLEQLHLNGPSLRYNFRLDRLYAKEMNDMADAQLQGGPGDGLVPNIAPEYFLAHTDKLTDPFRNSVEWGSSFVIVPWQQYQFTGDDSLLRRYYPRMARYVDFVATMAKGGIVEHGLGDWYDIGPKPPWGSQLTPPPFTATAVYYWDLTILADVATRLGHAEDAAAYTARAATVREAFNARFLNAKTGRYATGSQCTSAMPLVLGLCPPEQRDAVLKTLIDDVRAHGNGLSAGDVGYRFVLRALADAGRSDVIFDMNNQSDRPGYGMQLARGATALTEKWDAGVGSFGSQNHFMLGQINEWFFHDLAGIQPDPAAPGFASIVIKPAIVGDVAWVKCGYRSPRGPIRVGWRRADGRTQLDVTIPPNCTATVYVPTTQPTRVTESEKPAGDAAGVRHLRDEAGAAVFTVGSGSYQFAAP